ncbi:ArpU family phage packaging/lysis transcriptional regulator [Enterococcus gallinarum]|uniref:ArpU family phage packaging/lysis transcriptional regulator n=1 Tax=Enterococcus gallinarum TaxID=1353 RepID=UPI001F599CDA|nr:ArpU family phage packaging/lysis transcriptional regulator [Enterococcus gallinarum]
MSLFPEIDENKTRDRVRELLNDYMPMKRRVSFNDSVYDLTQAIQYSDMPKSQSSRNGTEHKTAMMFRGITKQHQNYHRKLAEIDYAIDQLPDIYQQILKKSYCVKNTCTINELAASITGYRINAYGQKEEFHYSIKNIERLKAQALIAFAEAYKRGELISLKN